MEVNNQMKVIAKKLAEINGQRPRMGRYYDENKENIIDLVIMEDNPNLGETTYGTIGLCNYDIGYKVEDKPLRVEIIGTCLSNFEFFGNIISTCAFNIINSEYSISPGTIYPDVIKMYYPDLIMKHILFVSPFLWDDKFETIHFEDKEVAWVQAIPISEEEYAYAEKNGTDALEDLLEQADIDILDLKRESVI